MFSVLSVKVRTVAGINLYLPPCQRRGLLFTAMNIAYDRLADLIHKPFSAIAAGLKQGSGDLNPDPHARMTSTLNAESVSFLDLLEKERGGDEERVCIIKYTKPRHDFSTIYIQLGPVWKSQSKVN